MSENDLAAPPSADARRVALLAKPGPAREKLRQVLDAAGARVVLEEDPNRLQPSELEAAEPQVVLVALEPGTEDCLSGFDSVLHDPAVAVIYDEAELAAQREGWEAQRWARHLKAKLNGHADVLPPGGELESAQPEPGRPTSPAQLYEGARMETHLEEAQVLSLDLPLGGVVAEPATANRGLDLEFEPATPNPDPDTSHTDVEAARDPSEASPAASVRVPMVLELEPEQSVETPGTLAEPAKRRGALLMFAGIGGPDAVRKVLAELPVDFPRPVLVQLRLDGGRYDNLVKQMARVSVLPVELAMAGRSARPMRVYVLPEGVAMHVVEGVVHFSDGDTDTDALIASLPPIESAVLMLSGSDGNRVDPVMALGEKGAFVAGQSPKGCYDAVASQALAARGGMTGSPAELAARAVAHLGA